MKMFLALAFTFILSADAGGQTQADSQAQGVRQADGPTSGKVSPELAEAERLSTQVVVLYNAAKFNDALPLAERALTLREKALGGEHSLVAPALINLAAVLTEKEKYERAEPLLRRALSILEKTYGTESPALINPLRQLSVVLARRTNYNEAEAVLQRAVAVAEKNAPASRERLADSLYLLSQLYVTRGEVEKAAPLYYRALTTWRDLYGKDDPRLEKFQDTMTCLLARALTREKSAAFSKLLSDLALKEAEQNLAGKTFEGDVINGKALSKPQPSYPLEAKQQGVSGTVVIKIVVDETGKVIKAKAICGHPILAKAGEDAARRATFTPTLREGKQVKVTGIITYTFVLQ